MMPTPLPDYLRGHENWAYQYAATHNEKWPSLEELIDQTASWWAPGRAPGTSGQNYRDSSAKLAAEAFARRRGRMPGTNEMDIALSDLATERGNGIWQTPIGEIEEPRSELGKRAVDKVRYELSPMLRGAGGSAFSKLANKSAYDYATYGAQESGAPSFYDYLRNKAQTMTRGGAGENSYLPLGVAPLTWEQVSGAGAGDRFKNPEIDSPDYRLNTSAVIGAWLNRFAPNARGDVQDALINKLQGYTDILPQTGNEGYGDYLGRMMQGYL